MSISFILSEKQAGKVRYGRTGLVYRLNDSDSHKMVIKNVFQYILKVLELIECCGGDPYKTTNRNFVRYGYS